MGSETGLIPLSCGLHVASAGEPAGPEAHSRVWHPFLFFFCSGRCQAVLLGTPHAASHPAPRPKASQRNQGWRPYM